MIGNSITYLDFDLDWRNKKSGDRQSFSVRISIYPNCFQIQLEKNLKFRNLIQSLFEIDFKREKKTRWKTHVLWRKYTWKWITRSCYSSATQDCTLDCVFLSLSLSFEIVGSGMSPIFTQLKNWNKCWIRFTALLHQTRTHKMIDMWMIQWECGGYRCSTSVSTKFNGKTRARLHVTSSDELMNFGEIMAAKQKFRYAQSTTNFLYILSQWLENHLKSLKL